MNILIITAPFEAENTGDITYARQIEQFLSRLGQNVRYLRAQELGLATEVGRSLDTSIRINLVQDSLKKIGDSLIKHILDNISNDTVLFIHFRVPHTGFSFSAEHLSQLKLNGYRICALIHEHASNREEPVDIERNYQTAQLIPFFDRIIMFNPADREGLLKTTTTRNFYHCVADDKSLLASTWTLFQVGDTYPSHHLLKKRISLIPVPILSAPQYEPGSENRPNDVLMFGTIRRNKGNTAVLNLAHLLVDKKINDMQIKIVGRVFSDPNGLRAFQQYTSETYPEGSGFVVNLEPLEKMLERREAIIESGCSLDDYETRFNVLCKEIISNLELQVTHDKRKALHIELHIDVNDAEFKVLCHQSRYGMKFDKKGFCNNASSIINMMGLGLLVISNRTHMTDQTRFGESQDILPLVLLDEAEPSAEHLFEILSNLESNVSLRQKILKNLEQTMTDFFDPMRVTSSVLDVLQKTAKNEEIEDNKACFSFVSLH